MYSLLVVSDDNSTCSIFRKTLDENYIIYAAKEIGEALQMLMNRDIDIVFLDILLPNDGANKLLEMLRQVNTDSAIVMIIPESQPELSEESISSGVYELIEKPLKKDAIQRVSKRIMESQALKREIGFVQSQIKRLKPETYGTPATVFSKSTNMNESYLTHMTYKEIFQKFSKALTQFYNAGKLADLIIEALAEIFKVGRIVFILIQPKEGLSRPYRCLGFDVATMRNIYFGNSQGMIHWLSKNHQILNKVVLDREIEMNQISVRDAINIQKELNLLQAQLCMPVFASGNLRGVITLGNKITGKAFFDEDIEMLSMLAGYIGMAMENAFLYQEINLRKIHSENVLESIPYGIVTIDTGYKVNTINKSAARMLDILPENVLGRDVKHIGSVFADFLLRTIKEKKTYKMKEVIHPVTNAIYDVSTSLLVDCDQELGAIMIFSDLSEVVKIETKIRDLEKMVVAYVGKPDNTIPNDITQAVASLSKDWISERQRLLLKHD
ncbi:MAG: response regulator [Candidatus Loosdrechtia sp.]|uniref:response regulator n=1 Tax=Candidatus Loosdrechtia sp. TaxID=3101272 RepID=UPI003A661F61|nr:MAG: response regulator [Candidatus Jettenia sp. AMX2]